MVTATRSLRIRPGLRSQIERLAHRSRRSFSDVTQELIDEALRMRQCPGIYFADEPEGREAKVAGTGLGVWEVVAVYRAVGSDDAALRERFGWLNEAQVQAALLYYRHYVEEIDLLIEDNERSSREVPPALTK